MSDYENFVDYATDALSDADIAARTSVSAAARKVEEAKVWATLALAAATREHLDTAAH